MANTFAQAALVATAFWADLWPQNCEKLNVFACSTQCVRYGGRDDEPLPWVLCRDLIQTRQSTPVVLGERILLCPQLTARLVAED